MMTNPVGSLQANNAAYNWMQAVNIRIAQTRNEISFGTNYAALHAADSKLERSMLQDSFEYRAYTALDDMNRRIEKQKIKRSFSIFND